MLGTDDTTVPPPLGPPPQPPQLTPSRRPRSRSPPPPLHHRHHSHSGGGGGQRSPRRSRRSSGGGSRSRSPRGGRSRGLGVFISHGVVPYKEFLRLKCVEEEVDELTTNKKAAFAKEFRSAKEDLVKHGMSGVDGDFFRDHKEEEW
jgi:hypothetical protein